MIRPHLVLLLAAAVTVRPAPAAAPFPPPDLAGAEALLVAGHRAFLLPPPGSPPAGPRPWVWYAPTLPGLPGAHERWMFALFQAAGLAIAGIDVGESYGSPAGRRGYTSLHTELVGRGYSPRPVLLGRSRGGLMLLAWAAEHPELVAAFAGIYPVCNLASYPGLERAAPAYGLAPAELAAELGRHNPVDRLAGLAARRVPLLAVHGDDDRLVPLADNSSLLRDRYLALGGPVEVIVPAGQGHNLWPGFFRDGRLVAFVLAHARR